MRKRQTILQDGCYVRWFYLPLIIGAILVGILLADYPFLMLFILFGGLLSIILIRDLDALLVLTCITSLVIPRSGTKIAGILPVTVPSLLFILLAFCWLLKIALTREPPPKTVISNLLKVYLSWGVISLLRGFTSGKLVHLISYSAAFIGFPIMYFIIISLVRSKDQLKRYTHIISGCLFIVSLYGFAQVIWGDRNLIIPGVTMSYFDALCPDAYNLKLNLTAWGVRMYSTFHNGNLFGQHLVTFIPLVMVMSFAGETVRLKIWYLLVTFLSSLALLFTLSRGALIGLLGGILFIFILTGDKRLKLFCLFVILVIVLGVLLFGFKERFVDQTFAYPTGGRWPVLQVNLERLKALSDFKFISLVLLGVGLGGAIEGIHVFESSFLTILFDMGLIGLILFLVMMGRLIGKGLLRLISSRDPFLESFLLGALAGLIGALIHHNVDALFLYPPIAQNFWMLVGLAAVAMGLRAKKREKLKSENFSINLIGESF